jgi:hypothetical protein
VVPALGADRAHPAVPAAVVAVVGEELLDRLGLPDQERNQDLDCALISFTHAA